MASELNMVPRLPKKIPSSLDPLPTAFPMESSTSTCCQSTQCPSCLYAQPPGNFRSKPSVQKHSSIELLDEAILKLMNKRLAYQIVKGKPSDTIQQHTRDLMMKMVDYIQPFAQDAHAYDLPYRDTLLTLLASSSKQLMMDRPIHECEWVKLLHNWVRDNSSDGVVFTRDIFQIMAVDGFCGLKPKDLKQYLNRVLVPIRAEFTIHMQAVRAMYDYFKDNAKVNCLTGTDSACVIFLALLNFYVKHLEETDDQVLLQVNNVREWTEGYLLKKGDYYRDVKNVDEDLLREFGQVYAGQISDKGTLTKIAHEMLRNVKVPEPQ